MMKIKFFVYIAVLSLFIRTVSADVDRIVTTEEPPTNYTYQGVFTGTTTDIVEEIKKRLGLSAKIEVKPWACSYAIAKSEANVAIYTAGRTQERIAHGFHFIGPVASRRHILWKRRSSPLEISGVMDIKENNLVVGAMRGDWREKYFVNLGVNVESVTVHHQNMKKLLAGRIHLWASSDIEAPSIADDLGIDMSEVEVAYVFDQAGSYIMLSRETPKDVVDQWREAYQAIQKTDFFVNASHKWSKILGYTLKYKNDRGFYVEQRSLPELDKLP